MNRKLLIELRNTYLSTDIEGVKIEAKHCISSLLTDVTLTDELYKIITADTVNREYGVLSEYLMYHLSLEHNIDNVLYRMEVEIRLQFAIVCYKYRKILKSLKAIYNSDVGIEVRWGRLERCIRDIEELRNLTTKLDYVLSFLKSTGLMLNLTGLDEIQSFVTIRGVEDIDFEAVDTMI